MGSSTRLLTLLFLVTTTSVILLNGADSARILCVFPTASKSHVLGMQALMKNLAKRGHEITMVSAFPLSKPVQNYRDVNVPIEAAFGPLMANFMQGKDRNMLKVMPVIVAASLDYTNTTLNSPQFRKLVDEERFDLAVVGWFMNDYVAGIGQLFKCPTALYFSAGFSSMVNFFGNPAEVAAVPHMMLGNKNPMGFLDRVQNTLIYGVDVAITQYLRYKTKPYYDYNFPEEQGFLPYDEAKRQVSLVIFNSYFTQAVPRPYLPNVIEVGGLQIKPKPDPLPADIQAWLDGAEHGAIFLSFGSNLKSSNLRQDKFDAILAALSKLKQRIIWKWDTDVMPGKPANVMIGQWLPQDDILAHKNLVLFVTHCGLGSVTESMYHGVPIVGIPMFGDQEHNAAQVLKEGWGEVVTFEDLTEETLSRAIRGVLGNEQYRQTVQKMADLYRDRPQTGLDLSTFWLEYVVRHKGAPHLHYQGADLNFLQRNLIDVFAAIGVVLYVVFKILGLMFRTVKRVVCGQKKPKQKRN
ncbi:hypothetical protein pipiens_006108 [Culex pipiens pipiens]|uniref:UDP-glucuronosyltransferase n=1 Tax=Culex pipiens pipiens TaxID=38569 RepID=A0ABD1DRL9_CULPP